MAFIQSCQVLEVAPAGEEFPLHWDCWLSVPNSFLVWWYRILSNDFKVCSLLQRDMSLCLLSVGSQTNSPFESKAIVIPEIRKFVKTEVRNGSLTGNFVLANKGFLCRMCPANFWIPSLIKEQLENWCIKMFNFTLHDELYVDHVGKYTCMSI